MRLIDADKIVYSWQIDTDGQEHDGVTLQSIINKMPTIEPERTGEWIECDGDLLKTMCKCSECGAMIDINEKYRNFFC